MIIEGNNSSDIDHIVDRDNNNRSPYRQNFRIDNLRGRYKYN